MNRVIYSVIAVALLAFVTPNARANSILYVSSTPVGGGAGTWNYTVQVAGPSEVQNGDFFVILDFGGYLGGSISAPAGWIASVEAQTAAFTTNTGTITPVPDSSSIWNLRFTWNGGAALSAGTYSGFKAATSIGGPPTLSSIVSKDHSTVIAGVTQGNSSPAVVPGPQPGPLPVPLPSTASMGLLLLGGLGGMGGIRRLGRRNVVV
jgi:hypothetical protein